MATSRAGAAARHDRTRAPSWPRKRKPGEIAGIKSKVEGTSDVEEYVARRRAPFSANSRPVAAARPRAAGYGHADHRPPRAGVSETRQGRSRGHQDDIQDLEAGHHLHRDGDRRLGGGP